MENMQRRKQFHKFNHEKEQHEYFFSELQLYLPHNTNLKEEKENFELCQKRFLSSDIPKVKCKIMEFLESVEDGLAKAQELKDNSVGDEMDPQNEQDRAECEEEGVSEHPDYVLLNPENLDKEAESTSTGLFKTVELCSQEELESLTSSLDSDQRLALNIILNYSQQLKMSRSIPTSIDPPLLIIQGGAGAGKSLLIRAMGQWFEKMLRQSGDDPDKPYILITAFTGTAAANVDGMTLHSAFNFNFGNTFLSLGDKTRDEKREQLKNLKMVVIDEYSMVKADMFYQLDLRLRELKQNTEEPFGGCSIILLGDLLQLKPVLGRYIFEQPLCTDYHITHLLDPLWNKFQVLLLTYNHRQGEDFAYAEILNRVRTGDQSSEDCSFLQQRVRPMGHADIPENALFIICTNKGVNEVNEVKLESMEANCHSFLASVYRSGKPANNPKKGKDGSVFNTPLQMELKLKIGAQVMLTHNLDVLDSLTNGTIGKVVGFERDSQGVIKSVLVHFKDKKSGKERRKRNSAVTNQRFPNTPVTPIEKIEFRFNTSKNPTSQNDFMTAIQFPLKLCFACTAHKMQGSTVVKPDSLAIDLTSVREAAQGYVMMSRVQSINQLFILEKFETSKLYPSPSALEELKRLQGLSLNAKDKLQKDNTLITSLNVRSLSRHLKNLKEDPKVCGKVIALQETWCNPDQGDLTHILQLPGYNAHFVSQGRGKGIATFYKKNFKVSGCINNNLYQMSKVTDGNMSVINVYISHGANKRDFLQDLGTLVMDSKSCFVVGDFNIDFLQNPSDLIVKTMTSNGFKQIVKSPTHNHGGLLDHVYVKQLVKDIDICIDFPFYSDHAMIAVFEPPDI